MVRAALVVGKSAMVAIPRERSAPLNFGFAHPVEKFRTFVRVSSAYKQIE